MKYSAREKDAVLRNYYKGNVKFGNYEIEDILIADGYLKQQGLFTIITEKGRGFYFDGGYTARRKKECMKTISGFARAIMATAVGSAITILIEHALLPWLLSLP